MRTKAKTKEVKVIQMFYGAWEDVVEYEREEYGSIAHDLKEYNNDGYGIPYRVITRRVKND